LPITTAKLQSIKALILMKNILIKSIKPHIPKFLISLPEEEEEEEEIEDHTKLISTSRVSKNYSHDKSCIVQCILLPLKALNLHVMVGWCRSICSE
jgi:hypothetical protein